MVQSTSPNFYENLAGDGLWIRHVAIADNIQLAVRLKAKGFHFLYLLPE
jgi:hypothetical protein